MLSIRERNNVGIPIPGTNYYFGLYGGNDRRVLHLCNEAGIGLDPKASDVLDKPYAQNFGLTQSSFDALDEDKQHRFTSITGVPLLRFGMYVEHSSASYDAPVIYHLDSDGEGSTIPRAIRTNVQSRTGSEVGVIVSRLRSFVAAAIACTAFVHTHDFSVDYSLATVQISHKSVDSTESGTIPDTGNIPLEAIGLLAFVDIGRRRSEICTASSEIVETKHTRQTLACD